MGMGDRADVETLGGASVSIIDPLTDSSFPSANFLIFERGVGGEQWYRLVSSPAQERNGELRRVLLDFCIGVSFLLGWLRGMIKVLMVMIMTDGYDTSPPVSTIIIVIASLKTKVLSLIHVPRSVFH